MLLALGGCGPEEEVVPLPTMAERLETLCPVPPDERPAFAELSGASLDVAYAVLPGPHAGRLDGQAAVLTLTADLSTVPAVWIDLREERVPDVPCCRAREV
jgi:hypothetical protein